MKSLLKAIDTIDAVAEAGNVGIRELSAITGFPPSTIHRIVTTLVERNYFQQDPVTRRYSLSYRFLELGFPVSATNPFNHHRPAPSRAAHGDRP